MPAYVVSYKKYVEEGDNRDGWAGYKDIIHFCDNEMEYIEWMDSTEHMRQASYRGRPIHLISIKKYDEIGEVDCPTANAESAYRVDKKERAEKKAKLLKEREELDKQINEL